MQIIIRDVLIMYLLSAEIIFSFGRDEIAKLSKELTHLYFLSMQASTECLFILGICMKQYMYLSNFNMNKWCFLTQNKIQNMPSILRRLHFKQVHSYKARHQY